LAHEIRRRMISKRLEKPWMPIFPGGGEMGERIRLHDWGAARLGMLSDWPMPLRIAVSLCVKSPFPIIIHTYRLAKGTCETAIYCALFSRGGISTGTDKAGFVPGRSESRSAAELPLPPMPIPEPQCNPETSEAATRQALAPKPKHRRPPKPFPADPNRKPMTRAEWMAWRREIKKARRSGRSPPSSREAEPAADWEAQAEND